MATSTYLDVDKLIVGSRVQLATAQLRPHACPTGGRIPFVLWTYLRY